MREYRVQIVYKTIDELKPYKRNPRNNDGAVDAVAASIKEFGFKIPIVIDTDGEIIAGHTRLKAAQKLGLAEVPCIIADDLTPDQIKAFRLADNEPGEPYEDNYEPEPPTDPKTKSGELFKLGNHYLLCGDATSAASYARLTGGVYLTSY